MADTAVLATLRDIHLPGPVSMWPLAPAYYVLLTLLLIATLTYFLRKRTRRITAPKREALEALKRLKARHSLKPMPQETAAHITTLLRRTALVYHPRADVASLHDDAWIQFLNQTSKAMDFNDVHTSLLLTPFNPASQDDLVRLFDMAEQWIKQRGKKCSN